ncbi:MAG: glycoside hydrolase family 9 protein [Planctomycetota bacterium]|nr:glycoside hydrolase family 9 protein [Planctomycetota bacterium]
MKRILVLAFCLCSAVPARGELSLKELSTASSDVLVAYFKSTTVNANEVNTADPSQWKLNGQPVTAINKFVTEADACDHHIYLHVPALVSGTKYTLQTPHGEKTFVFDDRTVFCESIKTNQSAYSGLSKVRYANFAIWLGDGGTKQINGDLPTYTVFKMSDGAVVAQGTLQTIGQDQSSGDFVYRIDLSAVPEGGPYKIAVKGYGCSYPFGVGGDFSRRLGYVSFRSLYHQRCGCPIVEPYAWNIKADPCHMTIYQVNGPIGEARLVVTGNEPTFTAFGGYHDAGDADRRTYHMDVPVTLMTTYEAFPQLFTDDQFNIPDKFDEKYRILGKGNGIPDIIDEAMWGTMFWEYMQEPSGAIHWGTETRGYSPFTTYEKDPTRFGTEVLDPRSASFASGMFMHMARLIKPYNAARFQALQKHAEMAFAAAGEAARPTHRLYFAVQKYLLTGDQAAHQAIKDLSPGASGYSNTYNGAPESFASNGWLASFFYSYIIEKERPTDPAVVDRFKAAIKAAADKEIGYLNANAYPVGTPLNLRWWGSNTAQGQYAYPCLLQWSLTKEQKYIDAACQLMDYVQGLNPIGKCYMTGTGFNPAHNPHDRESAFTKRQGWGPRPGILVFGPGGSGRGVSVPNVITLARERRYIDNLGSIQWSEFTVYQSLCFPAAVYPVLGQGGKYDQRNDRFGVQRK